MTAACRAETCVRPSHCRGWCHDWTTRPADSREHSAREVCLREAARPFQLDSDLMLRATLHKLADDRWWLFVLMHHSATDGWSAQVLRQELQTLLEGGTLPPLPASYSTFARWQHRCERGRSSRGARQLLANTTRGTAATARLAARVSPPRAADLSRLVRRRSSLPPALTRELRELGRTRGATLFMTLLAGWTCLLSRYTDSTDICVGTPVAGRGKVEFENLIGLFMNTLVLRTRLDGDPTFLDALERVRETCLGAWDHDLPFESLLKAVPPQRSLTHTPYFQVYFQLRNFPRAVPSAELPVTDVEFDFDAVPTDLHLEITETSAGLHCRLSYNTALFTERFARAMLGHFEALLRGAITAPGTRVSRLPIMGAGERAALISRRLPLQRPPAEATVVELFEQQAVERREQVAILFRDRRVTYGELNQQANRLARVLAAAGVGPERIVALCMARSPEWIVAMLAIAKAGGAYMSLEPDYPPGVRGRFDRTQPSHPRHCRRSTADTRCKPPPSR